MFHKCQTSQIQLTPTANIFHSLSLFCSSKQLGVKESILGQDDRIYSVTSCQHGSQHHFSAFQPGQQVQHEDKEVHLGDELVRALQPQGHLQPRHLHACRPTLRLVSLVFSYFIVHLQSSELQVAIILPIELLALPPGWPETSVRTWWS